MNEIKSKDGQPIQEGDHVYTKFRGGRREGEVSYATHLFTSLHC
jgi:hypothetical protein